MESVWEGKKTTLLLHSCPRGDTQQIKHFDYSDDDKGSEAS